MPAGTQTIRSLPKLSPRRADANKGQFGKVLIVGGSGGMIGAPALAANACLRGGAGLATVAVPQLIQQAVATLCPCATSLGLACRADGDPAPAAVGQFTRELATRDVLAIGPGMGKGPGAINLVRAAIAQDKPVVIDADGLNNLTKIDRWSQLRRAAMILTPHPGEFSRLSGRSIPDIQADRTNAAVMAARQWAPLPSGRAGDAKVPLVVVLKGEGTVVTDGRRVYVNTTGNAGMATGGTGDVLTGLTAALLGQHLECFEAACLAVYVHGLAGDLAARDLGQVSLIASDLLDYLPAAFAKLGRSRQPRRGRGLS